MRLTPALREELKKPLGRVVKGTASIPKDAMLLCIGDRASDTLISAGFRPKLVVYDGYTQRRKVGVSKTISSYDVKEYRVKNPAGLLTEGVFKLFRKVLGGDSQGRVYVDGEEDLTALAAIAEAPVGAVLVYGQPNEGLVVVDVDDKIKEKVKNMLKEMKDGC
jgi:GTP-dependent dephospho-CoA kinase